MAVLSVNAGSSSLKFAVYPLQSQTVGDALLTGTFEGLEPGGQPSLSWTLGGQAHEEVLPVDAGDGFAHAFGRLRDWLRELPDMPPLRVVLRLALSDDTRRSNSKGDLDIVWPFRLGAVSLGIYAAR